MKIRFFSIFLLLLISTFSIVSCSGHSGLDEKENGKKQSYLTEPTAFVFDFPKGGKFHSSTFYNFPYPSNARVDKDGVVDLAAFPNPKLESHCSPPASGNAMVENFLTSIEPHTYVKELIEMTKSDTRWFSANPNIYLRFNNPLNSTQMPTPSKSLDKKSPVFLMNIDPKSPHRGERVPIIVHTNYESRFLPDNVLVVRPSDGFSLRFNTTYAVVVTDQVRDVDHKKLEANKQFQELATDKPFQDADKEKLRKLYFPMFDYLKSKHGLPANKITAATVFKVGDPTAEQKEYADFVLKELPAPKPPESFKCENKNTFFYTCRGFYESPIFQHGLSPFLSKTDGFFTKDAQGKPKYEWIKLRFLLTVPKRFVYSRAIANTKMPVVMYGHGTGGNYETPLRNGTSNRLAKMGVAVFAIDQAANGKRTISLGGQNLDFLFFNALNLRAARDNVRQSALDYHWQVRFIKSFKPTISKIKLSFDEKRLWFMGHSQGALIGPLFLAFDNATSASFLSAPGGFLVQSLLTKVKPDKPIKITDVMSYMLCDKTKSLRPSHPILSMFQHFFDPADPINYARFILSGKRTPTNFFMTEGTKDSYATPQVFEPLAVAIGTPLLGAEIRKVSGLQIRGIKNYELPVQGNFKHASGTTVTVGFTQHDICMDGGSICDGHFVTFNNPDALLSWQTFFSTLVTNGIPTVH